MKKYIVTIVETKEYKYLVEAENKDNAEEEAGNLFSMEYGRGEEDASYDIEIKQMDMTREEIILKIDELTKMYEKCSLASKGLREKSKLLLEIADLKEQLEI
jgi:hypothetical protein